MRIFQPWPFSLRILQTGGLCLVFFQPASSQAACESAERFFMWLFLATILLCVALCCLQHWLKRRRCFSSQRTLAVFALSDADLVYENDVAPAVLPKVHPHLQSLEKDSSDTRPNVAGDKAPPSYEEIVKNVSTRSRRGSA